MIFHLFHEELAIARCSWKCTIKTALAIASNIAMNSQKYIPAIGMSVFDSCVKAASSINVNPKWLDEKSGSTPRALTRQPAVDSVQTKTRYLYKNFKHGNLNSPFFRLHTALIDRLTEFASWVFAYIRNNSPGCKTFNNLSVISSQASLLCAQIKTLFFVVRTITAVAATNTRVLPVPGGPNSKNGSGRLYHSVIYFTAVFCSRFNSFAI